MAPMIIILSYTSVMMISTFTKLAGPGALKRKEKKKKNESLQAREENEECKDG
jgi:hypothetical protein